MIAKTWAAFARPLHLKLYDINASLLCAHSVKANALTKRTIAKQKQSRPSRLGFYCRGVFVLSTRVYILIMLRKQFRVANAFREFDSNPYPQLPLDIFLVWDNFRARPNTPLVVLFFNGVTTVIPNPGCHYVSIFFPFKFIFQLSFLSQLAQYLLLWVIGTRFIRDFKSR